MPLKINIWRIIGLLAIVAFAILFFKIVIYIAISLVLFLVGYPITYKLERIKFGKRQMPDTLSALITILLIVSILFGLFFLIIPPLALLKLIFWLNLIFMMCFITSWRNFRV